jgi:hypothetical protein
VAGRPVCKALYVYQSAGTACSAGTELASELECHNAVGTLNLQENVDYNWQNGDGLRELQAPDACGSRGAGIASAWTMKMQCYRNDSPVGGWLMFSERKSVGKTPAMCLAECQKKLDTPGMFGSQGYGCCYFTYNYGNGQDHACIWYEGGQNGAPYMNDGGYPLNMNGEVDGCAGRGPGCDGFGWIRDTIPDDRFAACVGVGGTAPQTCTVEFLLDFISIVDSNL